LVLALRRAAGDLGDSVRIQKPVSELIVEKLPVTIQLAAMAMLIALVIASPQASSPQ